MLEWPDNRPILTLEGWGKNPDEPTQLGFFLRNDGDVAMRVKVGIFRIKTSKGDLVTFKSNEVNRVPQHGTAFAPIYTEAPIPILRWALIVFLEEAYGEEKHTEHCIPIEMTYEDSRGVPYKTLSELLYIPIRDEIKFRHIRHEKGKIAPSGNS